MRHLLNNIIVWVILTLTLARSLVLLARVVCYPQSAGSCDKDRDDMSAGNSQLSVPTQRFGVACCRNLDQQIYAWNNDWCRHVSMMGHASYNFPDGSCQQECVHLLHVTCDIYRHCWWSANHIPINGCRCRWCLVVLPCGPVFSCGRIFT